MSRALYEMDTGDTNDGKWPWACLRCGDTIYHDGIHCQTCRREVHADDATPSKAITVIGWIRQQSYPKLIAKTTIIVLLVNALLIGAYVEVWRPDIGSVIVKSLPPVRTPIPHEVDPSVRVDEVREFAVAVREQLVRSVRWYVG